MMVFGLYFVTYMAGDFTLAAHDVYAQTQDAAVKIPDGFKAGALDFASSPLAILIYALTKYKIYIGAAVLCIFTLTLVFWNRRQINKK